MERSPLESLRMKSPHIRPSLLQDLSTVTFFSTENEKCQEEIFASFPNTFNLPLLEGTVGKKTPLTPLRIGAVFSGGPAAGGHNVLAGIFDALGGGSLIGFLGGPGGIITASYKELSKQDIDNYRNLGGFDLLGSGRTKIETKEQMESVLKTCQSLDLDGLVIIGGDDSNTNAAILAEFFKSKHAKTKVIGVPKTIDGDLKNPYVPISFGFDTACRVYSELIGNICKDAKSAQKYTHFIKLMGRSASHVTLECALSTQPNYALIGEEVHQNKNTLAQIVSNLCDLIGERSKLGKNYGVILVPEGLIEFIPEIASLIQELNTALSRQETSSSFVIIAGLSQKAKQCFDSLPEAIQKQILLRRDPHGNVQVSLIETEKLLADLVGKEIEKRKAQGLFSGSFHPMTHFLGYEGRCAIPSDFDAAYCYTLGLSSALLFRAGASGYMTFVSNPDEPISKWKIGGVPLTSLLHMEVRKDKKKPVIQKALVSCEGAAFTRFIKNKDSWALKDAYLSPGPMQFHEEVYLPISVSLELAKKGDRPC
ncbi:MAG: diphosphate--fructose-6-phosphate 1-phosphotransferase [Chlamydiota bacterium]